MPTNLENPDGQGLGYDPQDAGWLCAIQQCSKSSAVNNESFPIQVLQHKRKMLLTLLPAVDDRQAVADQVKELEKAIERLRLPTFKANPFL